MRSEALEAGCLSKPRLSAPWAFTARLSIHVGLLLWSQLEISGWRHTLWALQSYFPVTNRKSQRNDQVPVLHLGELLAPGDRLLHTLQWGSWVWRTQKNMYTQAHVIFILLGEPIWIFLNIVFAFIGFLSLDITSGTINGINKEPPPLENRCFRGSL